MAQDLIGEYIQAMENTSRKNDIIDDKMPWDLLPWEDIEDVVAVYKAGAKKYGKNSWQNLENGMDRYFAAMMRHFMEYRKGNKIDEETGCKHLAQVVWNAIAMLHIANKEEQTKTTSAI